MTSAEYHALLDRLLLKILRTGIHKLPKELRGSVQECMQARMDFYQGVTEGVPSSHGHHHDSDIAVNDLFAKTKH